jgi:predicted Fe-Mo cluster-binding NifX family protein
MRVAIPEHLGRVAPVFDCCRRVLIVLQTQDTDEQVADEDWSALSRITRPIRLKELMVDVLICGGISCWMEDQIHRTGIRLVPWIAGEVWDVLTALREGSICEPCYLMPGRGWCRRGLRSKEVQGNNAQAENPFEKGA